MSRPSSSASSSRPPPITNTTVPFTPRPKQQPRDRDRNPYSQYTHGHSHAHSDRDLDQIAQTLASVRKVPSGRILAEINGTLGGGGAGEGNAGEAEGVGERSYIGEEGNYARRPLTSRVASSSSAAGGAAATATAGGNKGTRNVSSASASTATGSGEGRRDRERERERRELNGTTSASAATSGSSSNPADLPPRASSSAERRPYSSTTTTTTSSFNSNPTRERASTAAGTSAASTTGSTKPSRTSTMDEPPAPVTATGAGSGATGAGRERRTAYSSRPESRGSTYPSSITNPNLNINGNGSNSGKGKERARYPSQLSQDQDRDFSDEEDPSGAAKGIREGRDVEGGDGDRKLRGLPLIVQEAWVCEDLRFVLHGVQGEIIKFAHDYDPEDEVQRLRGARWRVDTSLDPSLKRLLEKILPLATFFTGISAFVDLRNDTTFGMVNHALASGIRTVLRDYHILTAKLESLYLTSPSFTLQSLFQHLHPTLHILSLLYALCISLDNDPFPDIDADADASGNDSDADSGEEEQDAMQKMAAEFGLDLEGLGLGIGGKKQMEGEAARGLILGGEVLGVIVERAGATSGDPAANSLYASMLLHASQPYAKMVVKWISTGILQDPYEEFLIKEDARMSKGKLITDYSDEYWDRRYTLRDGSSLSNIGKEYGDLPLQAFTPVCRPGTNRLPGGACIPPQLEPWKFKILLAGKYLNVIKECGVEVGEAEGEGGKKEEVVEDGLVRLDRPAFYRRVESAYFHANRTLLHMMLHEKELLPYLRSIKHFFFLDQSEFLNQFLDNAASELKKPAKSASMTKIQSLLYMAVSNPASASSLDPYKDQLKVELASQPLFDWLLKVVSKKAGDAIMAALEGKKEKKEKEMTTIEALTFDFEVQFPISLVISRKSLTRYQLLFRFLLGLRYLESSLTTMWTEHKSAQWRKPTNSPDIERWKRRIYILRAQMLQWVQHMLVFATSDVLDTNWKKLEDKLGKVGTVDQLMRDHVEFLDACLKECTLTDDKLITVTSKLITTITAFTSYQSSFTRALNKFIADPNTESTESKVKGRWEFLEKFETHFRHHAETHLDTVTYLASSETPILLALVARLAPLYNKDGY